MWILNKVVLIAASILLFNSCCYFQSKGKSAGISRDTTIIRNDYLEIKSKSFGAELISIKSKKNGLQYLWQGDTISWQDHAILQFPIIANVKEDRYIYEGKEYEIMSHGFARISLFSISNQTDTSITYTLKSNEETLAMYPFHFTFNVSYTLIKNKLEVTYFIQNTGNEIMYFSAGYHPGFRCPIYKNEAFEDYILSFEKVETAKTYTFKGNLLTEDMRDVFGNTNQIQLSKSLFELDALVFEGLSSTAVTLMNKNSNIPSVTIEYGNVPYLAIWSSYKESPFVCIEPWFGLPDVEGKVSNLKNKVGIEQLVPNETFNWKCSILFH
ncbi:MAG: aldose 1-epimerase family protein [Bacteroidetes bacterium]|nr:aldose 1-epimerase family protein [Bacteroidota bacterium]